MNLIVKTKTFKLLDHILEDFSGLRVGKDFLEYQKQEPQKKKKAIVPFNGNENVPIRAHPVNLALTYFAHKFYKCLDKIKISGHLGNKGCGFICALWELMIGRHYFLVNYM